MPRLNSLEVVHQDTNRDPYHNLHDILTKVSGGRFGALLVKKSDDDFDIGWNTELVEQIADVLAKYEYLLEVTANDREALVREVKTLTASFNNADAQIMEELLVQASENQALAKKLTRLSAEFNDNSANINQRMSVVVTDQQSLAELVTDLDAEFSGNIATINSTLTTLANNDSAQASDITTLEARLDTGDFAAVKVESSATASKVSGIEAKWGVTVNANGNVAGIQLLNGTNTQSSFIVDATKFVVKKPNGTNGIEWDGSTSALKVAGDVYADHFYGTGVIGTGNVASNAITNGASAQGSAAPLLLNFTTSGNTAVFVWASARLNWPGGETLDIARYTNGSPTTLANASSTAEGFVSVLAIDYPPAGTHTYVLANTYYATSPASYPVIMLLETKR